MPNLTYLFFLLFTYRTEAEALACRTIAERGVQLIGTAHGQLLENLMKNPTLSDLVGGITSVTLGDEEARARGTQKSVLERKAPPTFPLVIEMRERSLWVAHWVEDSVDCLLTGKVPVVQVRRRDANTKKVLIQEQKYETEGGVEMGGSSGNGAPAAMMAAGKPVTGVPDVADGITTSVFDSMFGYGSGGFGSSFGSSDGGKMDDPYAWAARLRDIPEEEALAELAALGYTGGASPRRGEKFAFANGTGSGAGGGKKKSRRNSVGRAVSNPRRR